MVMDKNISALQKISGQAFELIASLSTILFIYFSLHGYLYDFLLLAFPALWLYIWSTTDDASYTTRQALIRFFIASIILTLPFVFWTNSDLTATENTYMAYQLRFFLGFIILLLSAMAAVIIEFKQSKKVLVVK